MDGWMNRRMDGWLVGWLAGWMMDGEKEGVGVHISTRNTPQLCLFRAKHNASLFCRDFPWSNCVPPTRLCRDGGRR